MVVHQVCDAGCHPAQLRGADGICNASIEPSHGASACLTYEVGYVQQDVLVPREGLQHSGWSWGRPVRCAPAAGRQGAACARPCCSADAGGAQGVCGDGWVSQSLALCDVSGRLERWVCGGASDRRAARRGAAWPGCASVCTCFQTDSLPSASLPLSHSATNCVKRSGHKPNSLCPLPLSPLPLLFRLLFLPLLARIRAHRPESSCLTMKASSLSRFLGDSFLAGGWCWLLTACTAVATAVVPCGRPQQLRWGVS
jgi:hypothetical protein